MIMEELINEIIALEWAFFDKVQNEGGRAPCQDDFRTFCAMRASQYEAWDEATLSSWRGDLTAARARRAQPARREVRLHDVHRRAGGKPSARRAAPARNGRETRARARRRKKTRAAERSLRRALPARRLARASAAQRRGRRGRTSIETYQLGELLTYSEKTLRLLAARIAELEAAGVSYAELIIENGLKRRGFRGLDDAEKFLEARR